MDAIIQEIEGLLQTDYRETLEEMQKNDKICKVIQYIMWLSIVLAYAATGCGVFLRQVFTPNAGFSILVITGITIATAIWTYAHENYVVSTWLYRLLLAGLRLIAAMCCISNHYIVCGVFTTLGTYFWMLYATCRYEIENTQSPARDMPSCEDIMEYVRRVRDGDIPMIHAEPIVQKSRITRNLVTSQEKGTHGIITITPEGKIPALTSIYFYKNEKIKIGNSMNISVPINTQQNVIQWTGLSIPDNAELPYTKITLFPEGIGAPAIRNTFIIRSQHACEFIEAFDAIGRIIVLECIRARLKKGPKEPLPSDGENKVRVNMGDVYKYFCDYGEPAASGHTAETIWQYTEQINDLLTSDRNITMDQCVNGQTIATIA